MNLTTKKKVVESILPCSYCNDSGMYKGYDVSCECENNTKLLKPKVGMLIKIPNEGVKEILNVDCDEYFNFGEGWYDPKKWPNIKPIAELEELKIGDNVWCINRLGKPESYFIKHIKLIFLEIVNENDMFSIDLNGCALFVGNGQQLFWRTLERAEKYGK